MGRKARAAVKAEKTAERKRQNRAAYVARQAEKGLKVWRTWATDEEIAIYQDVKKKMPKLLALAKNEAETPDQP